MIEADRERRRRKRFRVAWNARLKAQFPEEFPNDTGEMTVKTANFSAIGTKILAERIEIEGRHLTIANPVPALELTLFTPEGVLRTDVEIRWYRWAVPESCFEIGLEFIRISRENRDLAEILIRSLKRQKAPRD